MATTQAPVNQNQTLSSTLVLTSRMVMERKQTCVAFLIEGFFTTVFLFILDKYLIILQIPVITAFFLLYYPPSFAKELLIQQKLGIAMICACVIKSMFVIVNMVIYLVHYFRNNNNLHIDYPTVTDQVFEPYLQDTYLFPQLTPNNVPGLATFLGAILSILFALMAVFEIISIYSAYWIVKRTRLLMNKIRNIEIPPMSENAELLNNNNNNGEEEANESVNNALQVQQNDQEQQQPEVSVTPLNVESPENNA